MSATTQVFGHSVNPPSEVSSISRLKGTFLSGWGAASEDFEALPAASEDSEAEATGSIAIELAAAALAAAAKS